MRRSVKLLLTLALAGCSPHPSGPENVVSTANPVGATDGLLDARNGVLYDVTFMDGTRHVVEVKAGDEAPQPGRVWPPRN